MSALVVVAGQSLALGFGVSPTELPPAWRAGPDVMIWRTDHFEVMQPGVNTGTPANPQAWGPEVGFAIAWREHHPGETLYLVKSAKGSTGIADDPTQLDWSPASHELFDAATADIAAAKVTAWLPVSAILWVQGQQDAIDPAKAAAYQANLGELFLHMRVDWAGWDTPIILARIGDAAHLPYQDLVRAAQAQVDAADPLTVMVDADSFALQADHLHLSGAGEVQLGAAMQGALADIEEPPRLVPEHDLQVRGWALSMP